MVQVVHIIHLTSPERMNKILRKIDHMMIFVLIAGSYTPVCLLVLANRHGVRLLVFVWVIAVVGIALTGFWVNCRNGFLQSFILPWVGAVFLLFHKIVLNLSNKVFYGCLPEEIIYTIGGIIYAMKFQLFCNHFVYRSTRNFSCLCYGRKFVPS